MTAPRIDAPDRSICQYTGEVADGLSFPALLPEDANVLALAEKLLVEAARRLGDDARAIIAEQDSAIADLQATIEGLGIENVALQQAAEWMAR